MHEDIFTRAALNESVTFRAVEPLNRALLFHDVLLSHLAMKTRIQEFEILKRLQASVTICIRPNYKSGFQQLFQLHGHRSRCGKDAGIRT
jgi:hypothetical protein